MAQSNIFGEIYIGYFLFTAILVAASFVLMGLYGYLIYTYWQGKSLSKFFWLRLKSFTDNNTTLFEIFGLNNTISLEDAYREIGDGYRFASRKKKSNKKDILVEYIINKLHLRRFVKEVPKVVIESKSKNLIIPKSTYTINGVRTIPLLDLHPRLHKDIMKGLDILIEQNITTLEELEDVVDIKPNEIFFDNYTYKKWYELYSATKDKFEIIVGTKDISEFILGLDKTFRESIRAKDYNVKAKKKMAGNMDKYGMILVLLGVIAVVIRFLYLTFWG